MNEFRYQVLVASAEKGMAKEYRLVTEILAAQSAFFCGFPFPSQTDNYLWKLNQKALADADYCVLLLGNEYGPLSQTGVGYLHRLYAAAQAMSKPVISFVYSGSEKPFGDAIDQKRLEEFRVTLSQGVVYFWETQEQLQMQLETGFEKLIEQQPSRGWARPENLTDSSGMESKALKRQLALLKKELEKERAGVVNHEFINPLDINYQCKAYIEGNMRTISSKVTIGSGWMFHALAPLMMDETSESRIKAGLCEQLLDHERDDLARRYPEAHAFVDLKLSLNLMNKLKVGMRGAGLITVRHGKWKLTPLGEHRMLRYLPEEDDFGAGAINGR